MVCVLQIYERCSEWMSERMTEWVNVPHSLSYSSQWLQNRVVVFKIKVERGFVLSDVGAEIDDTVCRYIRKISKETIGWFLYMSQSVCPSLLRLQLRTQIPLLGFSWNIILSFKKIGLMTCTWIVIVCFSSFGHSD